MRNFSESYKFRTFFRQFEFQNTLGNLYEFVNWKAKKTVRIALSVEIEKY